MDITKLNTIVFSGGGVRGFSYIGFLLAFQDLYKTTASKHFNRFAGTSVGSLFALICVLGIDPKTCIQAFESFGLQAIFAKDPTWLLTNYALSSGESLESLVHKILELGNVPKVITFAELFKKTGKHFIATVIDIMTSSTIYLDHTNEGADMPIVKGLMATMAAPPLFPPVSFKTATKSMVFIDGGLLDDFPVSLFPISTTLGIRANWYADPSNPMTDLSTYYARVLSILQLSMHTMISSVAKEYPNCIYIDLGPIKLDASDVSVQNLIFTGYRATIARMSSNSNVVIEDQPMKYITSDSNLPKYFEFFFNK